MADVSKVNVNSTDYNIKDSNAMHKGVDRVTAGQSIIAPIGTASTADGFAVNASGDYSHASGFHTIAASDVQHVIGKYNEEDANGTYAFIVGGGRLDTDRKNIFTVDWNGDVNAGRSNGLTNDTKLPTGADVISYLNSNLVTGTITEVSGVYTHKRITKHFRTVFLEIKAEISVTSTGWKTIGTIDDPSMRPTYPLDMNVTDNNSSTSPLTCQIRIAQSGNIQIYSFKTSGGYSPLIDITYLV